MLKISTWIFQFEIFWAVDPLARLRCSGTSPNLWRELSPCWRNMSYFLWLNQCVHPKVTTLWIPTVTNIALLFSYWTSMQDRQRQVFNTALYSYQLIWCILLSYILKCAIVVILHLWCTSTSRFATKGAFHHDMPPFTAYPTYDTCKNPVSWDIRNMHHTQYCNTISKRLQHAFFSLRQS